jgi:riboflavin kinase/FMN adenylyltransferase
VLVPAEGIYAAWALFQGEKHPGALYIGRRPTLGEGEALSVEVYILGLDEKISLYDLELEIQLLTRLRDDRRFDSLEALRDQIARDVAQTREFFAKRYALKFAGQEGQAARALD